MIEQELAFEKRIVFDSPGFVAFCPFAGPVSLRDLDRADERTPATTRTLRDGLPRSWRGVMRHVLVKIETALDQPAYNYIIHTAPFDTQALAHYHWHIEIIPRLTKTAGFEWGTGFYINPVPPEEAGDFHAAKWSVESQERARNSNQADWINGVSVCRLILQLRSRHAPSARPSHTSRLPYVALRSASISGPAQPPAGRQLRPRLRAGLSGQLPAVSRRLRALRPA